MKKVRSTTSLGVLALLGDISSGQFLELHQRNMGEKGTNVFFGDQSVRIEIEEIIHQFQVVVKYRTEQSAEAFLELFLF